MGDSMIIDGYIVTDNFVVGNIEYEIVDDAKRTVRKKSKVLAPSNATSLPEPTAEIDGQILSLGGDTGVIYRGVYVNGVAVWQPIQLAPLPEVPVIDPPAVNLVSIDGGLYTIENLSEQTDSDIAFVNVSLGLDSISEIQISLNNPTENISESLIQSIMIDDNTDSIQDLISVFSSDEDLNTNNFSVISDSSSQEYLI
jgi:hypothetical protein